MNQPDYHDQTLTTTSHHHQYVHISQKCKYDIKYRALKLSANIVKLILKNREQLWP